MAFIDISDKEQARTDAQLEKWNQGILGAVKGIGDIQETKRQRALKAYELKRQLEEQAGRPLQEAESKSLEDFVQTGQESKGLSGLFSDIQKINREDRQLDRDYKRAQMAKLMKGKAGQGTLIQNEDGTFSLSDAGAPRKLTKEEQELTAIDAALGGLETIKNDIKQAAANKVPMGPFSARLENVKGLFGAADPKYVTFRTQLRSNLSETVKNLSGTAASDKERENIQSFSPDDTDNEETMLAKIEGLKRMAEAKRQTYSQAVSRVGGSPLIRPMQSVGQSGMTPEQRQQRIIELRNKKANIGKR